MASVQNLISPEQIKRLATPSNLRLGRDIVDAKGVELLELGQFHIRGRVGNPKAGAQVRTTELRMSGDALTWTSTCAPRQKLFCKHCVALAIATGAGLV